LKSLAIGPFSSDDRCSFAANFPLLVLKAIRGELIGPELNWFLAWRANPEHVCPLGRSSLARIT